MKPFSMDHFTRRLIAETLFYDEEYGAFGSLSLIDVMSGKECYLASFLPEDGTFVIEKATEWEDTEQNEKDEIGYALAVDSEEFGTFNTPEAAAETLLGLAHEHRLMPSITLLFEEDELA